MKSNGLLPMEQKISVGKRPFCFYGDISSGNLYAGWSVHFYHRAKEENSHIPSKKEAKAAQHEIFSEVTT